TEDRYLSTRSEMEHRMAVLLGGRAAELLMMGDVSSGAADDLVKATDIAVNMVTRLGMTAEVGPVAYERQRTTFLEVPGMPSGERAFSDATARHIDEAVRRLVEAAQFRATEVLKARRELLEEGVQELLRKETLTEAELAPLRARARE